MVSDDYFHNKSNSKSKKSLSPIAEEDKVLWEKTTYDVEPLSNKNTYIKPEARDFHAKSLPNIQGKKKTYKKEEYTIKREKAFLSTHNKSELSVGDISQLDGNTGKKLKKGKFLNEGSLDLHGFTQSQAHHALNIFIRNSFFQCKRCVLVITGKGKGEKQGVLQKNLGIWLNAAEIREYILSFTQAQRNDGGQGAFYIYLKKNKSNKV